MTLNEYQEKAIKEAFYEKDDIVYNALGITGEAGEIADHVKKMLEMITEFLQKKDERS